MAENTYQSGNTVRLTCIFKDFTDNLVDPSLIKVIIYNQRYEQIEEFMVTNSNRSSIGEYYFDYTISSSERKLYYEWYGEINGVPSLKRGSFKISFI